MKNRKTQVILGIGVMLIAIMVYNVLQTPGIKELPGNFKEISFSRNEQNSGPLARVYVVTVDELLPEAMKQYGDYMPHTKYGTTRVFFFNSKGNYPQSLPAETTDFPETYREDGLAVYEKDGMSQVKFRVLR